MATAAFKSNTKRSTFPADDDSAASKLPAGHRRSRSLSRYSGRFPPPPPGSDGGSVNADSGFPEISLDDLADELHRRAGEEQEGDEGRPAAGRTRGRGSRAETESSRRRGRSVSKSREPVPREGESKGVAASGSRRQRSVSVSRNRGRGSEVIGKTDHMVSVHGDDNHSTSSNDIQNVVDIRRNYNSKLEQSEKRKQDLLAKLAVEEQRGQELTKIVSKLLPTPKQSAKVERPSRPTRRRNDKIEISKHLTEDAEKIFEDFLSSIEDTDISSYDGERSDTSSMIGGSAIVRHPVAHNNMVETCGNMDNTAPVKGDGVVLPWLQWEANFPSPSKSKMGARMPPGNDLFNTPQEASAAYYNSSDFTSSRGSWSPEHNGSYSAVSRDTMYGRVREVESKISVRAVGRPNRSFDMDEYAHLQHKEELLFEMLRQRKRIDTGSLILCGRAIF